MEKSNVSSSFFFFPFWHSFFVYDRRVPLVFLAKEIMNAVWGGGEASCPSLATLSVSAVFVVCVCARSIANGNSLALLRACSTPRRKSLERMKKNKKKKKEEEMWSCMKCGTERENRHVTRHDRARTQNKKKIRKGVGVGFSLSSLDGQRKKKNKRRRRKES
jgi:hypothetical protein